MIGLEGGHLLVRHPPQQLQNQSGSIQFASDIDEIEQEYIGSDLSITGTSTVTCDQQVNQSAAAGYRRTKQIRGPESNSLGPLLYPLAFLGSEKTNLSGNLSIEAERCL